MAAVGVLLSVAIAAWVHRQQQAEARADFDRAVEGVRIEVSQRFLQPLAALRAAQGLFVSSDSVERDEFQRFVRVQAVAEHLAGVRGLGYARQVAPGDEARFTSAQRATGMPDFKIHPALPTPVADRYVVQFAEPQAANRAMLGLDLASDPRRRQLLMRALATGEPQLTEPMALAQDGRSRTGFLLVLPLAPGSPVRGEPRGLLFAPLDAADLFEGLATLRTGHLQLELFSGDSAEDSQRFFGQAPATDPSLQREVRVAVPGRQVLLRASATPAFGTDQARDRAVLAGLTGLLLTAVLSALLHRAVAGQQRAEQHARRMTRDLDRLDTFARLTSDAVVMLDTERRITWANQGFCRASGFTAEEALGQSPAELLRTQEADPENLARMRTTTDAGRPWRGEMRNLRRDGTDYWVEAEVRPLLDADGRVDGFMVVQSDITVRRATAQALAAAMRQNEALLGTLRAHAIVSVTDAEGRIVEVNDAFCEISGFSRSELIGRTHRVVNSGRHPRELWTELWERLRAGQVWHGEICNRSRSGQLYWVDSIIAPFHGADGQLERIVSIRHDITARRALADELTRQHAMQATILENLPCGLAVFDSRLDLVLCNRQYRRLLDLPDALFEGPDRSFAGFIRFNAQRGEYGPGDPEAIVREQVALASTRDARHRFERRRPDGTMLDVRSEPLPAGGMVITVSDVSQRHDAEREAQRNGSVLRAAIETIDEAFVLYDPDDRLVLCNEKYLAVYAASRDLIVPGARFEDLIRAGAERGQFPEAVGRIDEWVAERMARHRASNSVLVQRLQDGRVLRIVERRLPDGHTVGFRIDITDLVRTTELAQQASLAKSQFLANMSHEIRTPLNAILGMLALLRRTPLSPRQDDYAAKTEGAARSLLGLLNDLLDFSKAEAGKIELDPHPFELDQLLRELAVILAANVGAKPVEVLYDLDADLPRRLVGDALRLQQVLINLCGNAIKFTERGEVVLSVRVAGRSGDRVRLALAVADTGIGIAPEQQRRIFEGFTQAEASTTRRFGGSGLGVAICQRLVRLMGGELHLESTLGRGSRFSFEVTLAEAEAQPDTVSMPGMRVLVVDDNEVARGLLQATAQGLGWQAEVAEGGEAALAMLRQPGTAFDALFVDWAMPGLDGWQTCERIRIERLAGPAPLVVMVTAHGRELLAQRSDAEQGLIDGFLVKPVTPSMLQQALASGRANFGGAPRLVGLARPERQRLQGLHLLLAEDNLNNQQVASELLRDEGAQVEVAGDGAAAVEAVARAIACGQPFDLVLMDLQMPVLDGYGATARLRELPGGDRLPVVAMTANAMASDRQACLAAGMDDHVGKPFDIGQLVAVVQRLTGRPPAPAISPPVLLPPRTAAPSLALPSAVQAAAGAADVDLPAAVARLGGKLPLYTRALAQCIEDLRPLPANLRSWSDQGEWPAAAHAAHTLKGLAGTLGIQGLAATAARAEQAVAAAGPLPPEADAARALALAGLCEAIERGVPRLEGLLAALKGEVGTGPADAGGSAPAGTGQPGAGAEAPPAAELLPLLRELARLLAAADMDALATAERVRLAAGQAGDPRLGALDEAVHRLAFDQAREVCDALIAEIAL